MNKMRMQYHEWLLKYKGRDIETITLKEHTEWSEQFRRWRLGNIEKVYP